MAETELRKTPQWAKNMLNMNGSLKPRNSSGDEIANVNFL